MKKILISLVLVGLLAIPFVSLCQQTKQPSPLPKYDPVEVLKKLVDWVFAILLIFAALMIVVAGFYFITAAGDLEKVKTARNFVLYAIIGVLVAFLARGLIWLVEQIVAPTKF